MQLLDPDVPRVPAEEVSLAPLLGTYSTTRQKPLRVSNLQISLSV